MKAKFADLGGMVLAGSPADFAKLLDEELRNGRKLSARPKEVRRGGLVGLEPLSLKTNLAPRAPPDGPETGRLPLGAGLFGSL